ncbi:MAG TPA: PCYCGC motif-containing (lipo)protein [Candidatus Limnocylindrales bacterium]
MGPHQSAPRFASVSAAARLLPVLALIALGGGVFGACSGQAGRDGTGQAAQQGAGGVTVESSAGTGSSMDSMPTMKADVAALAARNEAWADRPAFTRVSAATEEAYAYAMQAPQILQWMPCYCGCGGMGHGSNLDCYLKPTPGEVVFEEHASYCDICVQITLRTKQLIAQGASLGDARAAIDSEFAGSVPGTPTEVPPA